MSIAWQASPPPGYEGPRIALVHGLLAGDHMARHLLTWLREAGFADTSLYSNHLAPALIARNLTPAHASGRAIALIGYSQGGFQVVKTARLLQRERVPVHLMVSVAAGGGGRLYFPQWGVNARQIPANVQRHLNYFSLTDRMGTDPVTAHNFAHASGAQTHVENIAYPVEAAVGHIETVRCYPPERVAPLVRELFLQRLLRELSPLASSRPAPSPAVPCVP